MSTVLAFLKNLVRSKEARWAIVFCAVSIATRVPFRAHILHHWDSVNFALALDHFDVRLHQPHPPGTFVIYLALGKLFDLALHDPNASLVWLSVLLSGLGTAALYLLAASWYGQTVGATVAILSIASPLVWFHGEVALSYILEFAWVPVVVYACYRTRTGGRWALVLSALTIGLSGGIRPNTPVFLFPLWATATALRRPSLKWILIALVVMGLGVMVWAVPLVWLSGGPQEYLEVMRWWQGQHVEGSASLLGIAENSVRLGFYTVYALGAGSLLIIAAAIRNWPQIISSLKRDWRAQTIAAWALPASAYYVFIHLRQPGHTFTVQPALLLIAGLAVVSLAQTHVRFSRAAWTATLLLVAASNTLFFVAGPASLFGSERMLFTPPTWRSIREYDQYVTRRLKIIRESFEPESTSILADGRNFRLPDYYLSDYQVPSLSHMIDSMPVKLTEPINTLVLFDDSLLSNLQPGIEVRSVHLTGSGVLNYFVWEPAQAVVVDQNTVEIVSQ